MSATLIRVWVEEGRTGLVYSRSPDLAGLFGGEPDREALVSETPAIIQALYLAKGNVVDVHQIGNPEAAGAPLAFAVIPRGPARLP